MYDSKTLWGAASLAAAAVQYVPYFKGIFSGKVKPHAFTWLIWALPSGIAFFAQVAGEAGAGSWATGYTALMCAAIFFLSLKRGEKRIVLIDWATLFFALLAIVFWVVTKDPLGAVILAVIAGTLGWIPTVRKSIDKPYEESIMAYGVSAVKWLCAALAAQSMTLTTLLYPVQSAIATTLFVFWILMRRAQVKCAS